jgi:hypothetical protein
MKRFSHRAVHTVGYNKSFVSLNAIPLVTFLSIWFVQDGYLTQHQDIIMTNLLDFTTIRTLASIILMD